MKKCKNIECKNETNGKRVYCSLTCRNVFVNKYLRDYTKISITLKEKGTKKFVPKKCFNPNCDIVLSYDKRENKFCCNSCAASFTNIGRIHTNESKIKISESHRNKYLDRIIICKNCGKNFNGRLRRIFCSVECKKNFNRKDLSEFAKYKRDALFKFALNDFPDEFDFELVEKYGWYSPTNKKNNLDGISRDHMLSIREGFQSNIGPKIIAHPANCRLIKQKENSGKYIKSIISKDELIERIALWNIKYFIRKTVN